VTRRSHRFLFNLLAFARITDKYFFLYVVGHSTLSSTISTVVYPVLPYLQVEYKKILADEEFMSHVRELPIFLRYFILIVMVSINLSCVHYRYNPLLYIVKKCVHAQFFSKRINISYFSHEENTKRRRIMVTSSLNEISTFQFGSRLVVRG
jgi:hypothetical protein